jgi:hypothetical protein
MIRLPLDEPAVSDTLHTAAHEVAPGLNCFARHR